MTRKEPSLEALLGLSIELARAMKEAHVEADVEEAMRRHPSGAGDVLTAADRCDGCSAAALYRVAVTREGDVLILDWCAHHWSKHMPNMVDGGWKVTGTNPDLLDAMYGGDRA